MAHLRNNGIYLLPGIERPLYLIPTGEGSYLLYDCEFGGRLPPRFQIDSNGRVTNWFEDFPVWTIADLIDTGEDYER